MEAWTTGSEDIDLYLRWGDCPTKYKYDVRGFTTRGAEHEVFKGAPEDGYLYIGVRGYDESDYTLTITCDGVTAMCKDVW